MIFRYRVEYEFEAENIGLAQEALNKGLVPADQMTMKTLEAICSEDRIIPRKFIPKNRPSVVEFQDASEKRIEPSNSKLEHSGNDPGGTSPEPSRSRLAPQSRKIEEEDVPF